MTPFQDFFSGKSTLFCNEIMSLEESSFSKKKKSLLVKGALISYLVCIFVNVFFYREMCVYKMGELYNGTFSQLYIMGLWSEREDFLNYKMGLRTKILCSINKMVVENWFI